MNALYRPLLIALSTAALLLGLRAAEPTHAEGHGGEKAAAGCCMKPAAKVEAADAKADGCCAKKADACCEKKAAACCEKKDAACCKPVDGKPAACCEKPAAARGCCADKPAKA